MNQKEVLWMDDIKVISLFGKKSYTQFFPGIPVLFEDNYFVQFDTFVLYLPIPENRRGNKGLNLFEETVLQLLSIGNYTMAGLNNELCLEKDFLEFILTRLEEQGYVIKESCKITDEGNQYLGKHTKNNSINLDSLVPYYVPVRRDNGEILPILFSRDELSTGNADFQQHKVSIKFGTAGTEERVTSNMVTIKSNYSKKRLTQKDIRGIIRTYNKFSSEPIYISEDIAIESSFEPNIFFHIKYIIQEGTVDHIISSFGISNHTSGLLNYVKSARNNFEINLLRRAQNKRKNASSDRSNPPKNYEKIEKYLQNKFDEKAAKNKDEFDAMRISEGNLIRGYMSAIELSLHEYLQKSGVHESIIHMLRSQDGPTNAHLLKKMAMQAGIKEIEKVKTLFKTVSYNSYTSWMQGGEPSLSLLFPLAAGDQLRRPQSRFLIALEKMGKAATKDGDYSEKKEISGTEILGRLILYSNAERHSSLWKYEKEDSRERILNAVTAFITTLLPDFRKNDNSVRESTYLIDHASEQRLEGNIFLLESFGEYGYAKLPESIKNLLRRTININDAVSDPTQAANFFIALSSSIEIEFIKLISLGTPSDMEIILQKLKSNNALPNGLSKVNSKYYEMAMKLEKATLGAYALVWGSELSDDELQNAIDNSVFEVVESIAEKRGHATGWKDFNEEELLAVRTNAIEIIKYLERLNDE